MKSVSFLYILIAYIWLVILLNMAKLFNYEPKLWALPINKHNIAPNIDIYLHN